jgi:acyl transferase domain-containing protein/NAD(P)H-dependent flavin oxidoreductase YrpB (nitropropane dioxygenase family)/NADP-dependent 3-hydroxy acid dehydrogenase YdfG
MSASGNPRELVVGVSPFERPDAEVVIGIVCARALGVLDLGHDRARAATSIAEVDRRAPATFGVRVPAACGTTPDELPQKVDTVLLARAESGVAHWRGAGRRVLVEARSIEEARAAVAAGADGVIARGSEGGGLIGEETTYILVQQLVRELAVPVWAAGGIGSHTAAAAVAGGARGVVLDAQLALTRESSLPPAVKAAVRAMDGSETTVVGGHRLFVRPDLPVAKLAAGTPADVVAARLGADDLHDQLLPAGQEAAFAAPLAARWPTAGALVHGVRHQIASHLREARRLDPLAPGSPFAEAHGLRYPIAQGPMTRVSDRAEFAAAVAGAGGLPFLALSLMTGAESRELLERTAELLDGRPYGAGILGFVPPDVREAQLEAIREVRPPVTLIAGGRPSQARPLEEAGIATYLHVPSPGLLERFLREGARRFVFEGRECGGHVGPRSSFALWEAQVETILASEHAGDVSVLFAGGVHDARSAAMVAALAAPLAVRGARIGVLMGSAYLFTEEAVAAGAIQQGFQDAAIACEATVLLETAPGHSTRCADTEYVRAFEAERDRLRAAGTEAKEMWAALEVLNLGRLRIASKGLVRRGDEIVRVDDEEQRHEGMYMLGQVVALHDQTCTVAELHEDVSAGGSGLLASMAVVIDEVTAPETRPATAEIAVIGMACVFPGATNAASYWANVVAGRDSVTEVPLERWDPALYYDPESFTKGAGKKTPSKWGGFLPDVPFDALAYGIPPRSLAAIEPVQLLSLEVASQALADAGYGNGTDREFDRSRVSVVFGAEAGTDLASAYGFRALAPQYIGGLADLVDGLLPELTEDSFPGLLTNVIAGRVANRLDLGGVNFTVDAACASSLAAVDVAMKELRTGTSDMVLCGGADLHNGINDYLLFSSVHALSPKGRCASFDAAADGITLGEGVACVVLKRLEDARRDGDRVYAVVRAIAGSSDGRSLGLTAPRPEGQRRALERAYALAETSPAEVGLLEAHGTGTVVGDRTELAVLTELFDEHGADRGSCALGSVKSQVGHTKCAAGLAGLIKAARAVYHGVLPPTIHLDNPNPAYDAEHSPFVFHTEARPWLADDRVAGVSAFGFGGTNFHAVVGSAGAEAAAPSHGLVQWPAELFLLRGETAGTAIERLDQVAQRAAAGLSVAPLRDLAAAAAAGSGPVRAAVVARDHDDLLRKLAATREALAGPAAPASRTEGVYVAAADDAEGTGTGAESAPPVAFLFPGQGSQRPGMLADLFVAFPSLRRHLARDPEVAATMLPPAAFGAEERQAQADAITDTAVAQPALGIADLAAADLLGQAGVTPAFAGGHSYGELAALAVAGALPAGELVELSVARAEAVLAAAGDDRGAMAAVAAPADEVAAALERAGLGDGRLVVANDNAPRQVVISGPSELLAEAVKKLTEEGLGVRRINVACAFHSPVVAGAAPIFAERLAACEVAMPRFPVWSNATAAPYAGTADDVRATLSSQLASPVRFREQVLAMYEAGARVFVEAGPGNVLTGLVGKILADKPHHAIAVAGRGASGSDLETFLDALAQLAVLGVPVDTTVLFSGRAECADLSATPPVPGWVLNGQLVRTADGQIVPGALRPATEHAVATAAMGPPGLHAAGGTDTALAAGADPRSSVVIEYLRGIRESVAATREIVLSYLGTPVAPAAPITVAATALPAAAPAAPAAAAQVAAPPGTAADAAEAPAADLTGEVLHEMVIAIVSERTGYPVEMLDAKLDLEADLSIDSIKRLEIVDELAHRVGLYEAAGGAVDDSIIEELVSLKTLEGIVAWLVATVESGTPGGRPAGSAGPAGGPAAARAPASAAEAATAGPGGRVNGNGAATGGGTHAGSSGRVHTVTDAVHGHPDSVEVPPSSLRFVPRLVELELPPPAGREAIAGRRVAITDDGHGIAVALASLLQGEGANVQVVRPGGQIRPADGFVHLAGLAGGPGNRALTLCERVKEALRAGATNLLAVSAGGGRFGMDGGGAPPAGGEQPADDGDGAPREGAAAFATAQGELRFGGMRGVMKTVARELPGVTARLVDLDTALDPARAAAVLLEELLAPAGPIEIGRTQEARTSVTVVEEAWAPVPDPTVPVLDASSVVLLTGGARGVTAKVATAIARRWGCTLLLAGRSPMPEGDERPEVAGATTAIEMRRAFAQAGFGAPAEIESEVRRTLAARDIRATLAAIEAAGGTAEYHQVDTREGPAVTALVEAVYRDHGRLDGVVHGAGLLEDARLLDKDAASFARVYGTKVNGAVALADSLRPGARFVVLFGSVSGLFGNRGQVDYAAANDTLAELSRWLDRRVDARVVTIDWGPWAGGGMVSAELEREFARRGIGLLDADDAVERLLDELRSAASEPEVVVMRARPERFGWHAGPGPSPGASLRTPPAAADTHRSPTVSRVVDG